MTHHVYTLKLAQKLMKRDAQGGTKHTIVVGDVKYITIHISGCSSSPETNGPMENTTNFKLNASYSIHYSVG